MTELSASDRQELATRLLGLAPGVARNHHHDLPEVGATLFWQPGRGGGSLLVGSDGTVLFANSSVTFDAHVQAFAEGRRTDPSSFVPPGAD